MNHAWTACTTGMLLALGLVGCAAGTDDPYRLQTRRLQLSRPSLGALQADRRAQEAPLPEEPALADYLAYAQLHNPALQAAYYRWHAAVEQIPQARALPDPVVSYGYVIESTRAEKRQTFALEQAFPWYRRLRLSTDVAARNARAAEQQFEAARLDLLAEVAAAYAEYYYLGRNLAITEQNSRWLESIEQVLQAQYRVGTAELTDLVRAQVELGRLEDELLSLRDARPAVAARLNETLNRPANAPLPVPRDVADPTAEFTGEQLLAWLQAGNPQLRAADWSVAARAAGVDLARQVRVPDLMVGVEYEDMISMGSRDADDPVMLMFRVNLPIWEQRNQAMIRQARAEYYAARRERAELGNRLGTELELTLFRYRDAQRKVRLYRDTLLPKAQQALEVTDTAFRAGSAAFTDVVDAERVLLEFQRTFHRAQADAVQQLAQLERLIGGNLANPPDVSNYEASPPVNPSRAEGAPDAP